jgi:hypothetical protein
MLPKTHIILGGIFVILVYFIFKISILNIVLIFLASFLIDFDHYLFCVNKNKTCSIKKAYNFLKDLKLKKPVFMIFHTIEFHLIVFILGFLWNGFWFILIGMLFHSIMDIISLTYEKELWHREFSLIRYLILKKKYPKKYL